MKTKVKKTRLKIGKNDFHVGLIQNFEINAVEISVPGLQKSVLCRAKETDPEAFAQVFIRNEYSSDVLPKSANVILDAGANVGYSVLYFHKRYPSAKIIALEPNLENFSVLKKNCGHLENVALLNLALWDKCCTLSLESKGEAGGSWGTGTAQTSPESEKAQAIDIPSLMKKFNIKHFDICKIDIAGAEKEVFSSSDMAWTKAVDLFIVETYDLFKKGSNAAVVASLPAKHWECKINGENRFFKKSS